MTLPCGHSLIIKAVMSFSDNDICHHLRSSRIMRSLSGHPITRNVTILHTMLVLDHKFQTWSLSQFTIYPCGLSQVILSSIRSLSVYHFIHSYGPSKVIISFIHSVPLRLSFHSFIRSLEGYHFIHSLSPSQVIISFIRSLSGYHFIHSVPLRLTFQIYGPSQVIISFIRSL